MRADLWLNQESGCGCGRGLGAYANPDALPGSMAPLCSEPWVPQGDAGYACYGALVANTSGAVAPPATPWYAQAPAVAPPPPPPSVYATAPAPAPASAPASAPSGPSQSQIDAANAAAQKALIELQRARDAAAAAQTQAQRDAAAAAAAAAADALQTAQGQGSTIEISPQDAYGFTLDATGTAQTTAPASTGSGAWLTIAAAVGLALLGGS
jgi:hypothetical protein